MVVLLNHDCTAHAVALFGVGSSENPDGFHRLIGGGIEFGELAEEALRREVREELGTDVHDVQQIGVLQNIFHFNGEPGHEVVFVFTAQSSSPLTVPGIYADNGVPMPVVWRSVADDAEQVPLYPQGAAEMVRHLAATRPGEAP